MKYENIRPYIEKKLVKEQAHPEDPDVRIFNYTNACQYSKAWDKVTIQCRGLIMNVKTGEILARPFPKFFNYQEHIAQGKRVPREKPVVTHKMDGSLGILYKLNGKDYIATRGSFTSEQAVWATEWIREKNKEMGTMLFYEGVTHLFEIIYPQNRIVVQYDFSGLVHLAAIETSTGKQLDYDDERNQLGIRRVSRSYIEDPKMLLELDLSIGEGFVLFFPKRGLRLKVKFPEYVRLHRLVTGVSEIAIWELLKERKTLNELIERVPDEFYQWVAQTSNRLCNEFDAVYESVAKDYNELSHIQDPKEFAEEALKRPNSGLIFSMRQDKPIHTQIWRMIRPKGANAFKNDIDL